MDIFDAIFSLHSLINNILSLNFFLIYHLNQLFIFFFHFILPHHFMRNNFLRNFLQFFSIFHFNNLLFLEFIPNLLILLQCLFFIFNKNQKKKKKMLILHFSLSSVFSKPLFSYLSLCNLSPIYHGTFYSLYYSRTLNHWVPFCISKLF